MGHFIRPGRLALAEHATDAVTTLKDRATQAPLQLFLGLIKVIVRLGKYVVRRFASFNKSLLVLALPRRKDPYTLNIADCDKTNWVRILSGARGQK